MADENDDDSLPFVITYDVGTLPEEGIAIRLTYSTSKERHEARQWDMTVYGMGRDSANGLAKALLQETGEGPPPTIRPPRH